MPDGDKRDSGRAGLLLLLAAAAALAALVMAYQLAALVLAR